jgi:hypothetical protein
VSTPSSKGGHTPSGLDDRPDPDQLAKEYLELIRYDMEYTTRTKPMLPPRKHK